MPVSKDFLPIAGASGQGDTTYTIDQSIRFNDDDSAYMHRTPSSSGNRKTFTYSAWIKLGNLGINRYLPFPNVTQNANYGLYMSSSDVLNIFIYYTGSAWQGQLYTDQVFRDTSAWYHFVLVVDTTQDIPGERVRFYVNGTRVTSFSTENYPNQNQDTDFNNNGEKMWIASGSSSPGNFFDGYAAEIHWLDGYAYGPEFFGEFKADTDIWIPIEYTGSYGTNGFYIKGQDSSALGDDSSGNNNDLTTSGLAAHDQVLDSPTNNFCTFQPVMTNNSSFEFTEGNLKLDMNTNKSWYHGAGTTMSMSSGKWYWESYWNSGDSYTIWGILDTEQLYYLTGYQSSTAIYALNFNGIQPNASGTNDQYRQGQGGSAIATGQAGAPGGIWQFALDMDNKKMWLGYNGTYAGSGNPGAGSNETWNSTYIASDSYTPINLGYQISAHSILTYNFGQDSTFSGATTAGGNSDGNGIGNFKYSVPSGFLALCTKNLGS